MSQTIIFAIAGYCLRNNFVSCIRLIIFDRFRKNPALQARPSSGFAGDDKIRKMNMKKFLLLFFVAATASVVGNAQNCGPFKFPSYSAYDSVAAKGWGGAPFQLSQDYPTTMPAAPSGGYPWDKSDFRTKPAEFLTTVLDYCWDGMDAAKWVAQNNKVRGWYHAPWLDAGYGGREFIRGLVMDRTSDAKRLSVDQKDSFRSYSISYFNPEAAYTIGQVWCNPAKPDPSKAKFGLGSVIMKLVFTTADTSQVKHLNGAMEWEAFIEKSTAPPISPKESAPVRLLQVEVALRSNAKEAVNGWVYGVYVYDGRLNGTDVKSKMVPLGVQWGNDPGITPKDVREKGKSLSQVWISNSAWNQKDPTISLVQGVGYGYRLQGPIGNPSGSILSEHMTAGWPVAPIVPPSGVGMDSIMWWYRNLPHGTSFNAKQVSLDHSLELRDGIWYHAIANGADSLKKALDEELSEKLGFRAPDRSLLALSQEEEVVIDYDEGLTGRNLLVFIGFVILLLALGGLLVWNFMRGKAAAKEAQEEA